MDFLCTGMLLWIFSPHFKTLIKVAFTLKKFDLKFFSSSWAASWTVIRIQLSRPSPAVLCQTRIVSCLPSVNSWVTASPRWASLCLVSPVPHSSLAMTKLEWVSYDCEMPGNLMCVKTAICMSSVEPGTYKYIRLPLNWPPWVWVLRDLDDIGCIYVCIKFQ